MSEVMIDVSKIKVLVNNMGLITFISDNGKICFIHMHPFDTGQLVKFLVKEGRYDFSGKDVSVKKDKKRKMRGRVNHAVEKLTGGIRSESTRRNMFNR
jgi:hypothetical protein